MENDTYESMGEWHDEMIKKYIPLSDNDYKTNFDRCHLKTYLDDVNNFYDTDKPWQNSYTENITLVKCDEWVFSKRYFENTLNSEVLFKLLLK